MYGAIAGAAANTVGGILQSIAASQAKQAMADAYAREIQKQQGYSNQAYGGVFEPGLGARGVEQARTSIGEGSQQRQAAYQNINQTPLSLSGGQTLADRNNYAMQGKLRGNLGGYSDWALDQAIRNIRAQDELNKISNYAHGTATTFPYRMYDAQHSADELAFWGTMISGLGGGAQNYAQLFGSNSAPGGGFNMNMSPGSGGGYSSDFFSQGPQ
jgi:hypothetical protein